MSSRLFTTASRASLALALGLFGQAAHAQSAAPAEVQEVVVTGSFIAGTPEDAAVPVDVINSEALEKQGSPTMVQLVKTFTGAGAGIGESNRYNGGAGSATVNLRGFGSARTLVLMNSRRMADTTQAAFSGGGTDLDFIPSAAIGRIEVLKDGAAATYGSDAVAGVVNFITRKDLNGFEFDAQYGYVRDTTGDYEGNLAWGKKFDNGNVLLTAGYRRRSVLHTLERDWAIVPYAQDPNAGWTTTTSVVNYQTPGATNFAAGTYIGPDGLPYSLSAAQPIRDNGCTQLGGQLTSTAGVPQTDATVTTTSQCRFQFTPFNDLVNDEHHYQLYGEVNFEFSEAMQFHGEAFWSRHEVPRQRISPSNSTTNFPTAVQLGGTSASTATPNFNGQVPFFVPRSNPGYQATFNFVTNPTKGCMAPLTRAQCAAALSVAGLSLPQATWRAIAFSGDPNTENGGGFQTVNAEAYRVAGGFKGKIFDGINYDTGLTYMSTTSNVSTPDIVVNRLQDALNGYGSRKGDANQCTQAEKIAVNAGNAAAGCYYFNPFANAQTIKLGGDVPTGYFNPAVANDPLVLQTLYEKPLTTLTNRILVGDLVFSGELPFALPGGSVRAAVGGQYRKRTFLGDYSRLNNSEITPCVDSVDDGVPVCSAPTGALIFNASNGNYHYTDDVWAVFAEVKLPILDNLEVTGAIRHEDYGSIGTTTNPKIAMRYEPLDWLTFRASASTTFRAPTALVTTPRLLQGHPDQQQPEPEAGDGARLQRRLRDPVRGLHGLGRLLPLRLQKRADQRDPGTDLHSGREAGHGSDLQRPVAGRGQGPLRLRRRNRELRHHRDHPDSLESGERAQHQDLGHRRARAVRLRHRQAGVTVGAQRHHRLRGHLSDRVQAQRLHPAGRRQHHPAGGRGSVRLPRPALGLLLLSEDPRHGVRQPVGRDLERALADPLPRGHPAFGGPGHL